MKRFDQICGIAFVLMWSAFSWAETPSDDLEKAQKIPLDQIWGYKLQGSRDVRELEPKLDAHLPGYKERYFNSPINYIIRTLAVYTPVAGQAAAPAFVVTGSPEVALQNAYRVFKERPNGAPVLPKDTDLTLVFYSFVTGRHPRINCVERSADLIRIHYQFVAQEPPSEGGVLFALIPIGKFASGLVEVEIEQVPPIDFRGRSVRPMPDASRYVASPFTFEVR